MGSGFSKKKKQARDMHQQFARMQDQMGSVAAEGQAGNGLVTLTLSAQGELVSIRINPECVDRDDVEGLEALIKAAHKSAVEKLSQQLSPPAIA